MQKNIRILLFSTFVFLFWGFSFSSAHALDYETKMSFDVLVNEDGSADVTKNVEVKNLAKEFLASSLTITMPFHNINSLEVQSKNRRLPAYVKDGRLWVEFEDEALDTGESKLLRIRYKVNGYVEDFGTVKKFTWPVFRVEGVVIKYEVRIIYPEKWQPLVYTDIKPKSTLMDNGKQIIAYSLVDKELEMYVGANTLKQMRIDLDPSIVKDRVGEISFPARKGIKFLTSNKAVSIVEGGDVQDIRINLQQYFQYPGISIINEGAKAYDQEVKVSGYFSGLEKIEGIDTSDAEKIYKILLSRFEPETNVSEWKRESIEETILKRRQTDLDYANALVGIYRSKSIPADIVYGPVLYPDGNYYWHFWVVYQRAINNKTAWYEVDPYLEDLTGKDHFTSVPPTRMVWDSLESNSDLSDLSSELFLLEARGISFRFFNSATAKAGYIASQVNRNQLSTPDSVLGISDIADSTVVEIVLRLTIVAMGGFVIVLIYLIHRKFENEKS